MKKGKKRTLAGILVIGCFIVLCSIGMASVNNKPSEKAATANRIEIISAEDAQDKKQINSSNKNISIIQYIKVDEKEYPMYPVYIDKELAVQEITNSAPNLLKFLQERSLFLGPLEDSNWKRYKKAFFQNINELSPDLSEEEMAFRSYLDIRENDEKNKKVLDMCEKNTTISASELAPYLPDL